MKNSKKKSHPSENVHEPLWIFMKVYEHWWNFTKIWHSWKPIILSIVSALFSILTKCCISLLHHPKSCYRYMSLPFADNIQAAIEFTLIWYSLYAVFWRKFLLLVTAVKQCCSVMPHCLLLNIIYCQAAFI